jgi:hypothetical protein
VSNGGPLDLVLAALKELGGYFVWADAVGDEYVVMSRRDFEARTKGSREAQLDLLGASAQTAGPADRWTADDMLEKINRDLALYQLQQEDQVVEEETDGEKALTEENGDQLPLPPKPSTFAKALADKQGKRVRFEPLHGDLPPDLQ